MLKFASYNYFNQFYMKKLYTIVLAASVAFSAAAALNQKRVPVGNQQINFNFVQPVANAVEATADIIPTANPQATTIASIDDIAGNWVWDSYKAKGANPDFDSYMISIEVADAAAGIVEIYGLYYNEEIPVEATYDVATGTLTIENYQYIDTDEDGSVYFYFKDLDMQTYKPVDGCSEDESLSAKFINGKFTFNPTKFFAIGDPEQEKLGYYSLTYCNSFYDLSLYADPFDDCTSLYMGTMIDNTMFPMFVAPENEEDEYYVSTVPYEVEVLADESLKHFVVKEAFSQFFEYKGFSVGSPDLYLSDGGSYMYIPPTYTRLGNSNGNYFVGSSYGALDYATIITKEATDDEIVITMPQYSTYFIFAGATNKNYWGNQPEEPTVLRISLSNDGVNSVVVDAENAAQKEYFNLQGQRVANPTSGLYIVRQGANISKQIVK